MNVHYTHTVSMEVKEASHPMELELGMFVSRCWEWNLSLLQDQQC